MSVTSRPGVDRALWWKVAAGAVGWLVAYRLNGALWAWLVGEVAGLDLQGRLGGGLEFFLFDTVKIFLLLTGLMFVIGMLRASLDLDRARAYLEGKGRFAGLLLAVVLGAVTPFCSCSSIPLFIGFVAAGIPLSVTLTFLIASAGQRDRRDHDRGPVRVAGRGRLRAGRVGHRTCDRVRLLPAAPAAVGRADGLRDHDRAAAFTMSAIALSIPQAIMLRRVLKPPLLVLFFGAVTGGIVVIGYLFNVLFP